MFLVCGEALFDLFLESESGPAASTYAARAGGSPFNVAIGLARLEVLFPLADLVKISAEDLALLRPGTAPEALAADLTRRGVRLVVVTDGGEAAHGWTASGLRASATPPRVTVLDTVGAGDTFQAALIARLLRAEGGPLAALESLDAAGLAALLGYAARAAAITCSRRGADLPRAAELTD
jgi:fructokinase